MLEQYSHWEEIKEKEKCCYLWLPLFTDIFQPFMFVYFLTLVCGGTYFHVSWVWEGFKSTCSIDDLFPYPNTSFDKVLEGTLIPVLAFYALTIWICCWLFLWVRFFPEIFLCSRLSSVTIFMDRKENWKHDYY